MWGGAASVFSWDLKPQIPISTITHTQGPCFPKFYYEIYYKHLDPSRSLEVHADCWLGDLQIGQTAEVLWGEQTEQVKTLQLTKENVYLHSIRQIQMILNMYSKYFL